MSEVKLYLGDCLDVMSRIPSKSVNAVITDPPYFSSDKTRGKWDSYFDINAWWELVKNILVDGGAVVVFGNEPFSSLMRTSNLDWYRYDIKWVKNRTTGFANANYRPMNKYEDIMVFSEFGSGAGSKEKSMNYFPQGLVEINAERTNSANRQGIISNDTNNLGKNNSLLQSGTKYIQKYTNYPTNVIYFDCDTTHYHPTQKPVSLCEYLIKTYTKENDTVLDSFMGSGSTGVGCLNTNRNFIGIEKEQKYFDIAEKRIKEIKSAQSLWS